MIMDSYRGQHKSVDVAVQQGFGGPQFLVGVVATRGDDGEESARLRSSLQRLVQQGHHCVAKPRYEHADGAGAAAT